MPTVDGATPISQVLGNQPKTPAKTDNGKLDSDAFLKLLVAQLKYQDPTSPMDSSQMMAQSAQFTMVETMEQMAKESAAMLATQQLSAASALVGAEVTYPGPDNLDHTGAVTSARISADGAVLRIGDTDVPLSAVKEVAAPTHTQPTDSGPGSAGTTTPTG